jgi:hypothetical protein
MQRSGEIIAELLENDMEVTEAKRGVARNTPTLNFEP